MGPLHRLSASRRMGEAAARSGDVDLARWLRGLVVDTGKCGRCAMARDTGGAVRPLVLGWPHRSRARVRAPWHAPSRRLTNPGVWSPNAVKPSAEALGKDRAGDTRLGAMGSLTALAQPTGTRLPRTCRGTGRKGRRPPYLRRSCPTLVYAAYGPPCPGEVLGLLEPEMMSVMAESLSSHVTRPDTPAHGRGSTWGGREVCGSRGYQYPSCVRVNGSFGRGLPGRRERAKRRNLPI